MAKSNQVCWLGEACETGRLLLQVDQSLLQQLEAVSGEALGRADWSTALGPEVVANLGKYRKYNSSSLRDLLRVIRNKHNHFREMPPSLQDQLGPLPEGFLRYGVVYDLFMLKITGTVLYADHCLWCQCFLVWACCHVLYLGEFPPRVLCYHIAVLSHCSACRLRSLLVRPSVYIG